MSVFLRLQQAARARLQAITPAVATRFYGAPADRPASGDWVEERLLPLAPEQFRATDSTKHRAQLRLVCRTDAGADALRALAARVRAHFPAGLALVAAPETWVVTATAEADQLAGPGVWLACLVTIDLLTLSETP